MIEQDHFLRHNDEELRGGQHIAQVAHHRQVRHEDVEQQFGDDHFHVPRRQHHPRPARLEHALHPAHHPLLLRFQSHRFAIFFY